MGGPGCTNTNRDSKVDNHCLRPATLFDVLSDERIHAFPMGQFQQAYELVKRDLGRLYAAEWMLRGFAFAPGPW